MIHPSTVRPPAMALTDFDARELLAKPLLALCSEHGPTRVGKAIGCDEKTVRKARDEQSTLSLDSALNLLLLDGTAFDAILDRLAGRRSVPIGALCDTDDRATESSVLKAALALSIALSDDDEISAAEVRDNRETIEDAIAALTGLLGKLALSPAYETRRVRELRAARERMQRV
jgi:hypothetical protein